MKWNILSPWNSSVQAVSQRIPLATFVLLSDGEAPLAFKNY